MLSVSSNKIDHIWQKFEKHFVVKYIYSAIEIIFQNSFASSVKNKHLTGVSKSLMCIRKSSGLHTAPC